MSRARDRLAVSSSFSHASQVSARRQAIAAATEAPTTGAGEATRPELPLKLISENPDNPREKVGDVSDLVATLREIGLVQAITVATVAAYLRNRPDRAKDLEPGAEYVVVDGHRRHAAAHEAGFESIKYTVNDDFVTTDERLLEAAFVANLQRENLSDLEEAAALEKLVDHYGSQRKAAQRLGVTQAFISQRLSLLKLDPALQADLDSGVRKVEHVRGLAGLDPAAQRKKADERRETAADKAAGRRTSVTPGPANDRADMEHAPPSAPVRSDNAVITPAAESHVDVAGTAGDNAVITEPSGESDAVPVPPARRAAAEGRSADKPLEVDTINWQDARSVAAAATQLMPEKEIHRLLELLGENYRVAR
ncbi:ParB/RepB/Spo0J family partition protein [Streptomyces kronopolitis]|uniref:ParB/RepB/Spo0J family partition protein n=1 Tax=Streptomyces kronopolitis TaxID=1612435 RepID=UPI0036BFAC8C